MMQKQAADLQYHVTDRLSGRVIHGTNPGPRPYLSSVVSRYGTFPFYCAEEGKGLAHCHRAFRSGPLP